MHNNHFVYKMLHEHTIFCLLWLHFLRITKSYDRMVKFESRTSVRGWIHCSDTSPSCSDFCSSVVVEVMSSFQLISVLYQRYYKHSECSLYASWIQRNTFSRMNLDIKIKCTQLKWTAALQTQILPETWLDPWDRKPQNWQQSTAV